LKVMIATPIVSESICRPVVAPEMVQLVAKV
jgi:hypothetical protein